MDPARGFDGYFQCEYMGSAEFEFGAIPESLKRLRAASDIGRRYRDITIDGTTRRVWFVGSVAALKARVDEFEMWAAGGFRGKESSYFPECFTGRDWRGEPADSFYTDTVLWWALVEDVMFTLDLPTAELATTALAAKKDRA